MAGILILGIVSIFAILQTNYAKTAIEKLKNGSVDTRNLISIVNETPTRLKVNFRNGESFDLDITIPEESNATFIDHRFLREKYTA